MYIQQQGRMPPPYQDLIRAQRALESIGEDPCICKLLFAPVLCIWILHRGLQPFPCIWSPGPPLHLPPSISPHFHLPLKLSQCYVVVCLLRSCRRLLGLSQASLTPSTFLDKNHVWGKLNTAGNSWGICHNLPHKLKYTNSCNFFRILFSLSAAAHLRDVRCSR